MERVITAVGRLVRENAGQDLLEYALLTVLVAVTALIGVRALGATIHTVFWDAIASGLF